MRNISAEIITNNIKEMCIEANHFLSPDMKRMCILRAALSPTQSMRA